MQIFDLKEKDILLFLSLFLKWTFLVWLNAVISFAIAVEEFNSLGHRLGIICGIFTIILVYTLEDLKLKTEGRNDLRNSLIISVMLKSLFQFYPIIEIVSGTIALIMVSAFVEYSFIHTYLATIVDGVILSFVMIIIFAIVNIVHKILIYSN